MLKSKAVSETEQCFYMYKDAETLNVTAETW